MADNGLSSAFPPPPPEFELFTEENVALFKDDPTKVSEEIKIAMQRPALPSEPYSIFGERWPLEEKLPSLTESGVQQLYPANYDISAELKNLVRSVLLNFLELVTIMSNSPEQFPSKLEHIRTLMLNVHHLINSYRPHQTRHSLTQLMEQQIAQRTEEVEALEALVVCTNKLVESNAHLRDFKPGQDLQDRIESHALSSDQVNGAAASNLLDDAEQRARRTDAALFSLLGTI